jgi:hypothetical protein
MATAKSAFLQKFQNKISVVAKDGSHAKVGEPGAVTRPAPDRRAQVDVDRPWRTSDDVNTMRKSKSKPELRRHSPDEEGYGSGGRGWHARGRDVGGGSYAKPVEPEYSSNVDRLAYSKKSRPVEYRPIKASEYKAQYGNSEWQPGQVPASAWMRTSVLAHGHDDISSPCPPDSPHPHQLHATGIAYKFFLTTNGAVLPPSLPPAPALRFWANWVPTLTRKS